MPSEFVRIPRGEANVARLALRFLMERQRADGNTQDLQAYVAAYLAVSSALVGVSGLTALFRKEAFEPAWQPGCSAKPLPGFHALTQRAAIRWKAQQRRQSSRRST